MKLIGNIIVYFILINMLFSENYYVSQDEFFVSPNGTEEFPFYDIYSAINIANSGDSIFVDDGTYYESISINASLNIKSKNGPE